MQFIAPHPCTVPAFAGRQCYAYLFDTMTELADLAEKHSAYNGSGSDSWAGGTGPQAVRLCREGDENLARQSDKLMTEFENLSLDSTRTRWADAVSGGAPNVPAFLAGSPLAMRRRIKDAHAAAPLCVVSDTTISGACTDKHIMDRGSAILALVRLLSASRPVELWTLCAIDYQSRGAGFYLTRIETAPLDLGRAAFALTHPAFPRRLQYGLGKKLHSFAGHWPFSDYDKSRANLRALIAPYLPHADEILALPGAHIDDPIVTDPKAWLAKALEEFGPQLAAA